MRGLPFTGVLVMWGRPARVTPRHATRTPSRLIHERNTGLVGGWNSQGLQQCAYGNTHPSLQIPSRRQEIGSETYEPGEVKV